MSASVRRPRADAIPLLGVESAGFGSADARLLNDARLPVAGRYEQPSP